MLLRTDREGWNTWLIATIQGEVDAMREIWQLANESLTTEVIKNELLLRTDRE